MFALFDTIQAFLNLVIILIIINAALSWFRLDPRNPIIQLLDRFTSIILNPIRRRMPALSGLDISPVIAIILIQLIQFGLTRLMNSSSIVVY